MGIQNDGEKSGIEIPYEKNPLLLSESEKNAYKENYLYNETFLRLQNMDDSYKNTFSSYLKPSRIEAQRKIY